MLIIEGPVLWLVAIVSVMLASSVIALFTRASSPGEPVRPLVLSDEERQALETMAQEVRKRQQLERKAGRRETRVGTAGDEPASGSER